MNKRTKSYGKSTEEKDLVVELKNQLYKDEIKEDVIEEMNFTKI